PPFVGETILDRSTAHRARPAPRHRVLRPDVPTALDELYQEMMAKQPADRPASMTEVLDRLESCQAAVPGVSPSTETDVRARAQPMSSGGGRSKKRTAAPRDGRDAPISTQRDEAEGSPIGPEFSLEGLGIDVRPRSASRPSTRSPTDRAIRVPLAEAVGSSP